MKDTVKVVALNDFEIEGAFKMAGYIREFGKGFRRNHSIPGHDIMRYVVEEASDSRVSVSGALGAPRFRFAVKGDQVIFSTVNSIWPAALFYDFSRILAIEKAEIAKILTPATDVIDAFSTDINDYYLTNDSYSESISKSFRKGIEQRLDKAYISGMFYLLLGAAGFGDERIQRKARAFSESSFFEKTALAAVFCRGRGVPVYFAEGGVYYPLKEKDYCESIQEDFSRIFMKCTGGITPKFQIGK
jgi:hypothetical protein